MAYKDPAKAKEWREANKERLRAEKKAWYEANKESVLERIGKYAASELVKARRRAKYAADRDAAGKSPRKPKEPPKKRTRDPVAMNLYKTEWKKRNPDKVIESTQRRRARKINATPAWSSPNDCAAIYAAAKELSKQTGIHYHVDHVVPLRGRIVCRLHVPVNLQAVPANVNMKKGNRTWPDMP